MAFTIKNITYSLSSQPSLNELPATDASGGGGRKRAHANDENVDPSTQPPVVKQPRTIEIDLPNRYDDTLETNHKGSTHL